LCLQISDTIQQTVEGLSPAAAAASKLLKSGLTLTQIYSQYVAMGEELATVKEENQKLNHGMDTIFRVRRLIKLQGPAYRSFFF